MKTRKRLSKHKRKTAKVEPIESRNKRNAYIVKKFLELLNMVKLYHWKTRSYSQHKATDKLYERLNKHIDEFVEVLLGKENSRVKMVEKNLRVLDNKTSGEFKTHIYKFREFLVNLENSCKKKDSGLLSIRDEMLIDIDQFLYLMSLNT
jgi:DNA-binding ferritin-like protein|tara:strand:+ start:2029 stop:2475 length:447 start_codon:yes stop_codon:yes gene_type:complete